MAQVAVSPEYELLLAAMTPGAAPAGAERSGWSDSRWREVLRLAQWHRLSAILAGHLGSADAAPAWTRDCLQDAYMRGLARSMFIGQATGTLLAALDEAGIPAMLLKGAALVELVYSDPAVRDMGDIDILVGADRLGPARAALGKLGYEPVTDLNDRQRAWMRVHVPHEPGLAGKDGLIPVELHRHFVGPGDTAHFDISGVWERARESGRGPAHLLPCPEDLLLHVCIHFARNRLSRSDGALAQICDVLWILAHEEIDWEVLIYHARVYRADASVFLALLATSNLGFAVPGRVLRALRPQSFDPLVSNRLLALRILRTDAGVPLADWSVAERRLRTALAWGRDAVASRTIAQSAARTFRQPVTAARDYRLNARIGSLQSGERSPGVRSPPSIDVSIVVVTHRNPGLTRACLKSVLEETSEITYEIILVDNASNDGTVEMVREEFPAVAVHALPENLGFARANNLAVRDAAGRYVLLLNPDTVVRDGALQNLIAFAREHPEGGVYGGRTLSPSGEVDPNSCFGAPSVWGAFCFAVGLSTLRRSSELCNPEALGGWKRDTTREVGVVAGCLMVLERDLWDRLGGFDERFFMFGEDADISLRAAGLDYRPMITPSATITHVVGASSAEGPGRMVLLLRARVTLLHKHWPPGRRMTGVGLLRVGVMLRAAAGAGVAARGETTRPAPWREVWRMRAEWIHPYA